jgi:membrane-bound lytic murein transglycosylase B
MTFRVLAAVVISFLHATPLYAATCGGNFSSFLAAMSQEAQAKGISRGVIDQAFAGLTPDPAVLAFD